MTLTELHTMLSGIPELSGKVAYYAFPVGSAPELPYICYLETGTDNFDADNRVYHRITSVDIELYTLLKDPALEATVEAALDAAELPWEKTEDYLDTELCYMHTYNITI